MKGMIFCLMLAFTANTTWAGSAGKNSGSKLERRIRMSVSDQTSNYNRIWDEPVSNYLYEAYPKIGPYPVNDLCLEDNGATIRTILPIYGVCVANQSCDDDGVTSGAAAAYLTVPANEATATCTSSQSMNDGASVCRHFEFTPALKSYKVDEEVLIVNGLDDQRFQKTGNHSSYSIQDCSHH
jgi:hypothetical protein